MGRFADAADGIGEPQCSFGAYLDGIEPEDRADIEGLIKTKGFQYVIRLITELDGKRFSKNTVSALMRGSCRCHTAS